MEQYMEFEEVKRLLSLDPKNEERDRLLFTSTLEETASYLDRNMLLDTTTEEMRTDMGWFAPREYPVREILELKDAQTGETLTLDPLTPIVPLEKPGAHWRTEFVIQTLADRRIRVTYRYGYEKDEIPARIKSAIVNIMSDKLTSLDDQTAAHVTTGKHLESLADLRRTYI